MVKYMCIFINKVIIMILVIYGSPNNNGNTAKVLDKILEHVNEEVNFINAYKDKIKPCIDCKYCEYKMGCSIKDKMTEIYELIQRTDTLIIASPLYFATFSGELVNLISRFQTYFSGKYVRKEFPPKIKKGILLVTAGGKWSSMFVGVKETFNILEKLFTFEETKELLIPSCDNIKPLENEMVTNKINEIIEFIT